MDSDGMKKACARKVLTTKETTKATATTSTTSRTAATSPPAGARFDAAGAGVLAVSSPGPGLVTPSIMADPATVWLDGREGPPRRHGHVEFRTDRWLPLAPFGSAVVEVGGDHEGSRQADQEEEQHDPVGHARLPQHADCRGSADEPCDDDQEVSTTQWTSSSEERQTPITRSTHLTSTDHRAQHARRHEQAEPQRPHV
ncbi:hypothetical protein AB2L27_10885 [Kineococcus sp. LSe6-4]|uniref:Uncharacterized protein n=1 Tax=Kineococcus halophytocola TaxID=3234027 RepID=A0ABV4H372_9ACTN